MEPLAPPHSHFLSAAEGWLGLGNVSEARAEMDRIEGHLQSHPDVMELHWAILAQEEDWPAALKLARTLAQKYPDSPFGWLHHAYALRRVPEGGLQAAWDCLLPALKVFPKVAMIPYNLACYACQMQQSPRGLQLFKRALETGDAAHLKKIALNDGDLQPIWAEIREL